MKKEESVAVSFLHPCPPTEFALARHTLLDSVHSSTTTARKRATDFSTDVSYCGELLSFARTYFTKNF